VVWVVDKKAESKAAARWEVAAVAMSTAAMDWVVDETAENAVAARQKVAAMAVWGAAG